ncbi:glycosyltransferase [Clostridium perfringens]|uniref:glycosyltransferase n=1 Tax=Clostridium perfringens TaxID=1502 RepID=UPI00290F88AF|nr:glycosyltransferase [Clostridium perfringens]EHR1331029.1 glycosyltransferase [Clostridium perfringens]EHR1424506.1 glycosyltransferase [Clostridium perfringens]MDK0742675.1 glycosyltransferase [Clostridium perfringens]MDK0986987.1 glycosyltransferase [Clostridium perfringens]
MKNILISSFDMEIGGVERSLISMLNNFDYENYNVDLMLYSHTGDFMELLPDKPNLLKEDKAYKTFRMPIKDVFKSGKIGIGLARFIAKINANCNVEGESGYIQMQYMWKYSLPFLPNYNKEYDVAISYLWPHYYVAEKVKAKIKIAWIHTDYSNIHTNIELDLDMWNKFDYIISISEKVTEAFISKYHSLKDKIIEIENITSPEFIKEMSNKEQTEIISSNEFFNIVSVGRLSYAKGFDNAIKALKILNEKGFKNIKWYLIGYGGDESMLKNLIKENNLEENFILLGKKMNPYPYIKACDLYVQPSRYEGKAVTVSEAQILEKPVMITNYTTAKSQIEHKVDGYITDLSIDGIVSGIKELYRDKKLREVLSDNCNKNNYHNGDELEKLYKLI